MLGVEAWTTIRYLNSQGVGIRAICRHLGVSRTAVRRALRSEGPPQYQRPVRRQYHLVPWCPWRVLERWRVAEYLLSESKLVGTTCSYRTEIPNAIPVFGVVHASCQGAR